MPDFRSDTVTTPTAAMRAAIAAAEVGDDVFSDDPTVNRLEAVAAERLGHEAAVFAPSGTQTNLMALLAHCERGDEAIVGQQWHTYRWEAGGMAVLGSIQPQPLEHAPDGSIPLASIEAAIKPDDPHFARTRLVCLEDTTGGRVLPMDYLRDVRALAVRRGLATHLDGARLFNAAVEVARRRRAGEREGDARGGTATDPWGVAREICASFDSVSVCLSKGLGAPVGSLLLGSKPLVARARRWRKMLGGGMRQAGLLAAAGLHALEHHVERLAEDHDNARRLASGLAELGRRHDGALQCDAPHTNIVFLRVADSIAEGFAAHLAAHGVRTTGSAGRYGSGLVQRWVTHLDAGRDDVERALAIASGFFERRR
ncbi:MAG TPA: GntG family PLP-dependent aldolase [Burkholderiaceae bacterium]|nr:GntG family PLP-dependent aldolase [Burkholderiaceae bacterium]